MSLTDAERRQFAKVEVLRDLEAIVFDTLHVTG